jgi:hypothetical protein
MSRLRPFIAAGATVAAFFASSVAFGGYTATETVYISRPQSNVFGYFSGALASTRYSSDSTEYIGCQVYLGANAYCYAQDVNGQYAFCSVDNATQAAEIAALNPLSNLVVEYDSFGKCVSVSIANGSYWIQ